MDQIRIQGAEEHNLTGFDIEIPRNRLVVITGLSGSGKCRSRSTRSTKRDSRCSSPCPATRQFLGQMEKVDRVDGLSPTLHRSKDGQSKPAQYRRDDHGDSSDHLRLLMARLGTPRRLVCFTEISTLSAKW